MRKICLLATLLILPVFLYADNLPAPQGWISDFAKVISSDYRQNLTSLIQELEEKTSTEIAVVTVNSIAPYDEREYARLLFDNWKPGKKGKDNGVLVLLAIKERRWRIETGYGIEGILPDGLCGEIGRKHMVPYFKEAKYAAGLYNGVSAIAKVIAEDSKVNLSGALPVKIESSQTVMPIFVYFFAFFFFFLWNLPWPFIIGLPVTLLFGLAFYRFSTVLGLLVFSGYIASLIARYNYWHKPPLKKRKSFFGPQSYGGTYSGGGWGSGGFGSGGFGGGGFGGGGGGGGGAGGGF